MTSIRNNKSLRNKILQLSHDVSQEARDDHGRWTSSGGSGSNKSSGKKKNKKKVVKETKEERIKRIATKATQYALTGAIVAHLIKPNNLHLKRQESAHDLILRAINPKEHKLKTTMRNMQRQYNNYKSSERLAQKSEKRAALKKSVVRGVKLTTRKGLKIAQLIRYHAQKAINKYSRPGKVVGLLTHVKLAHDVSNEARDKSGRWTSSGGSSKSKKAKRIVKTGAAVAVGTAGIVHAYNKHQENLHKKLNHRMLHRIIKTANSHGVIVNKEYLKNSKHSNEIIHDIKHIMNTYHDRGSLPKLSRQINVYEKFNTLPRKHKIGLARKLSKHFNLKSFAGRAKSIAAKFSSKLVSGLM